MDKIQKWIELPNVQSSFFWASGIGSLMFFHKYRVYRSVSPALSAACFTFLVVHAGLFALFNYNDKKMEKQFRDQEAREFRNFSEIIPK